MKIYSSNTIFIGIAEDKYLEKKVYRAFLKKIDKYNKVINYIPIEEEYNYFYLASADNISKYIKQSWITEKQINKLLTRLNTKLINEHTNNKGHVYSKVA